MERIVSVRDRREHKLKIKVIKSAFDFNYMGYKQTEALNCKQGTEISEQI